MENTIHKLNNKLCWYIPKRYIILLLTYSVYFNTYLTSNLLSKSLSVWGNVTDVPATLKVHSSCKNITYFESSSLTTLPKHVMFTFRYNEVDTMSNFYWTGFGLFQIPIGVAADLYGSRKIILFHGIAATLLIVFGPTIINHSNGNVYILYFWNGTMGVVDSILVPAIFALIGQWTPKFQRTTMTSMISATWYTAYIVGDMVLFYILSKTHYWPAIFYLTACYLLVLTVLWFFYGYSTFEKHPFITPNEKRYLTKQLGSSLLPHEKKQIPWFGIIKSVPFWASFFNHIGLVWGYMALYNFMLLYAKAVVNVGMDINYVMGRVVPAGVMAVSMVLMSVLCDFAGYKGIINTTTARKMLSNFGAAGVSIYSVTFILAGCNQPVAYTLFLMTMVFKASYNVGVFVNPIDMSINFAGTLKGITNFMETVFFTALPRFPEDMVEKYGVDGWMYTMMTQFIVIMSTNLFFAIAGKASEQSWNLPKYVKNH